MKPYLAVLAVILFIATLGLVPDVYAQWSGGAMGGGMGGGGPGGRSGERQRPHCEAGERASGPVGALGPLGREQLENQLGALQVDLHLTDAQNAPWLAFADRILAYQADRERQRERTNAPQAVHAKPVAGAGIQPIARAVDQSRNRLTALEDIESTSRTLYQSLTENQKAIVDVRVAGLLVPLLRD